MFNEVLFFKNFRRVFRIKLSQVQVDTIKAILNTEDWNGISISIPQRAYVLATAFHESKFRPIKEIRARIGTALRTIQDKYWASGFYGRGLIQLTWQNNYQRLGQRIGVDLLGNPDLALLPEIAVKILFSWFFDGNHAGERISKYINPSRRDYLNARRLVNGTDQAEAIKGYAEAFEKILTESLDVTPIEVPVLPSRIPEPDVMIQELPDLSDQQYSEKPKLSTKQKTGLIATVIAFISDYVGIDQSFLFSIYDQIAPYWSTKGFRITIYVVILAVLYLKWSGKFSNIKARLTSAIQGFKNAR